MKRLLVFAVSLALSPPMVTLAEDCGEKRQMRIVGFQMQVSTDIPRNQEQILQAIKYAQKQGADFLITPEGSLSGYNASFDGQELHAALETVTTAAREAAIGLMLGTCFKDTVDGKEQCWNQVRVYSPQGEHLGDYSKILRCSPIDVPGTGEMLDYVEGTVRTFEWRGIRFGTLICNDLWATPGYTTMPNPYLPLKLKQQGAEAIFHVINSGTNLKYKPFHESSVELWAESLRLPIVEVNAAKSQQPVNAQSGLVDRTGERVVQVEVNGVHYFTCEINFD